MLNKVYSCEKQKKHRGISFATNVVFQNLIDFLPSDLINLINAYYVPHFDELKKVMVQIYFLTSYLKRARSGESGEYKVHDSFFLANVLDQNQVKGTMTCYLPRGYIFKCRMNYEMCSDESRNAFVEEFQLEEEIPTGSIFHLQEMKIQQFQYLNECLPKQDQIPQTQKIIKACLFNYPDHQSNMYRLENNKSIKSDWDESCLVRGIRVVEKLN